MTDTRAPAHPRLDGCPSCLIRNNAPRTEEHPDERTVIAHYVCRACGQDWQTSYWTADE